MNYFFAGVGVQELAGEEHDEVFGGIVSAFFIDDSDAVAVAVEADAEVGFVLYDCAAEVDHVFCVFGVGFVVGEIAVEVAEKFDDFAGWGAVGESEGAEDGWGVGAGDAVAGVDDYF